MSVQAMGWVMENSESQGATRCVLLSIANHVSSDGTGWVYVQQVMKEANCSEDTYRRAIQWAVAHGELEREINRGHAEKAPSNRKPNHFRLTKLASADCGPRKQQAPADHPPQGPQDAVPTDAPPEPSLDLEPSKEPSDLVPASGHTSNRHGPKRGSQLPDIFDVDDDLRRWAVEQQIPVDLDTETDQWRDYHRAKGDTAKDWRASWRTWMRNAKRFHRGNAPAKRTGPDRSGVEAFVRKVQASGQ